MGKSHEGELAVQQQAGVQAMAQRIGSGIHPFIFDGAAEFLEMQELAVIASRDMEQHMWASALTGEPGFLQTVSDTALCVAAKPHPGDPLNHNLQPGAALGLVAIDFAYRLRLRLNGTLAQRAFDMFYVDAKEVYGNCQKYIQARDVTEEAEPSTESADQQAQTQSGAVLTANQQSWIAQADTFFIATAHPNGGADASHRGGNPGFIRVLNEREFVFPDYSGNMMFNTLGNIAVNPSTGLLFFDFDKGRTLQLTGRATIIWDQDKVAAFPGAERLVTFEVLQAVENQGGLKLHFGAPHYSRFNPDNKRE